MNKEKEILDAIKEEYAHLLKEETLCYEIVTDGSANEHELGNLAREDGHASLEGFLNDNYLWDEPVSKAAEMLVDSVAMARAHEKGLEYDDLDSFLKVALKVES